MAEVNRQIMDGEERKREMEEKLEAAAKEEARLEHKMKEEVLSGVMTITIQKADIHKNTERFGKMDPFVLLTQH